MRSCVRRAVIAGCVVALSACHAGRYQHTDILLAEGCIIHMRGITVEVANDIKQRWDKSGECDLVVEDTAAGVPGVEVVGAGATAVSELISTASEVTGKEVISGTIKE